MERVRLDLTAEEYRCLLNLCEQDIRVPSDELRHLLRCEIARRGAQPSGGPEDGPTDGKEATK